FEDYVFGDTVRLRVFVDHSIVEVFVDNLTVISTRVYPGEDQPLIDLVVPQGSVKIERLDFYELGEKEGSYPTETCEPDYLPDAFFTGVFDLPHVDFELSVYPNPVADFLKIEMPEGLTPPFDLKIFDAGGRQFLQKTMHHPVDSLNVSGLAPGGYFLQVNDGEKTGVGRFFKQ
ncbi:MAG: GH32 C-terminal domain-containing protein, partial [Saprospiraceae bacterium]|nr:GH32 C-terminal domain-containing protein [Saprospiraceae bacterium]